MELSPAVIEWCQTQALSQVLVAWGSDTTRLSYSEVLEALEEYGSESLYGYDTGGIMVWDAFEDSSGSSLASQIEETCDTYIMCAKFVINDLKENN